MLVAGEPARLINTIEQTVIAVARRARDDQPLPVGLVVLDDDLLAEHYRWAERRTRAGQPVLLVQPDPRTGLTPAHMALVTEFVATLAPRKSGSTAALPYCRGAWRGVSGTSREHRAGIATV